mmetsp:Transcript_4546/g.11093  ORF Transcript_4546/g.11093 Transcript_4546/m.11093 type:complete len:325 (-) Transcript_4546:7673-8647(-)
MAAKTPRRCEGVENFPHARCDRRDAGDALRSRSCSHRIHGQRLRRNLRLREVRAHPFPLRKALDRRARPEPVPRGAARRVSQGVLQLCVRFRRVLLRVHCRDHRRFPAVGRAVVDGVRVVPTRLARARLVAPHLPAEVHDQVLQGERLDGLGTDHRAADLVALLEAAAQHAPRSHERAGQRPRHQTFADPALLRGLRSQRAHGNAAPLLSPPRGLRPVDLLAHRELDGVFLPLELEEPRDARPRPLGRARDAPALSLVSGSADLLSVRGLGGWLRTVPGVLCVLPERAVERGGGVRVALRGGAADGRRFRNHQREEEERDGCNR